MVSGQPNSDSGSFVQSFYFQLRFSWVSIKFTCTFQFTFYTWYTNHFNISAISVIDFGLSNFAQMTDYEGERRMLCRTQCGSPAYAAPELLDKQPYTFSVDVWSV